MELVRKSPMGRRSLRDLLATRRATLAVAVACALIAAMLIVAAVNGYRQSVSTANSEDTVLVANGLIQKGTSGAALAAGQLYTTERILEKHLAAGAITDAGLLQGKVATRDILPGQQLTSVDFAFAGGAVAQLAANQRAVEVQLDSSHGIGGVLAAGDRVDVYGGFNVATFFGGAGGFARPVIKLMISNVLVLQASGTGSGTQNQNVLLAVNENQAEDVAFAADNGKVWLVLRPGNGQNATQQITTINTILAGLAPIYTH